MVNKQNLVPLTTEKAREIGRKGGKASAKKKAERKTLKEELLLLLADSNNQNKISVALIQQAQKGNTKAYEIIADMIGEKPQNKIEVKGSINNPFEGMSTEELRKILND